MGNDHSRSGSDRCRSEHQSCATVCAISNSAPELGSASALDAIPTANCINTTCKDRYDICRATNSISAKGGISAGDGYSNNTSFNNGKPYRKQDDKVYIYSGGEIPYNGRIWNNRCYAIYNNGVLVGFTDSNGNSCDNRGYLGNEDTSNG